MPTTASLKSLALMVLMVLMVAPLMTTETARHDYPRPPEIAEKIEEINTVKPDFDDLIQKAVAKHLPELDWRLYKSLLMTESQLNPLAVSPTGALGLAQFMPPTWKEWSVKAGYAGRPATDSEASIMTGAMYLADLIAEWDSPRPVIDRYCLAFLSYNAGLTHVVTAQKIAKGALSYREIAANLHKVPRLSAVRIKDGEAYSKKILACYSKDVTG